MQVTGTLSHASMHMAGSSDELLLIGGHETGLREETIPRAGTSNHLTLADQSLYLTMWTAKKDFVASNITFCTSNTNRAPGVTFCRFALYSVDTDSTATLLAATASDVTLLVEMNLAYTAPITSDAAGNPITSYAISRGTRYALAVLWRGSSLGPAVRCTNCGLSLISLAPIMARVYLGQTDLPLTAAGTLPVNASNVIYAALT